MSQIGLGSNNGLQALELINQLIPTANSCSELSAIPSMPRGRPKTVVAPCRYCSKQFKRQEHLLRHERTRKTEHCTANIFWLCWQHNWQTHTRDYSHVIAVKVSLDSEQNSFTVLWSNVCMILIPIQRSSDASCQFIAPFILWYTAPYGSGSVTHDQRYYQCR